MMKIAAALRRHKKAEHSAPLCLLQNLFSLNYSIQRSDYQVAECFIWGLSASGCKNASLLEVRSEKLIINGQSCRPILLPLASNCLASKSPNPFGYKLYSIILKYNTLSTV
jgi:hypothetical protein